MHGGNLHRYRELTGRPYQSGNRAQDLFAVTAVPLGVPMSVFRGKELFLFGPYLFKMYIKVIMWDTGDYIFFRYVARAAC